MRTERFVCLPFLLLTGLAAAQTTPIDVGSGAPNEAIRAHFQRAYYRSGFQNLVSLPPLTDVRRLGASGLVQEFPDAAKTSGVRYALIKPNLDSVVAEDSTAVLQMYPVLYTYYNSLGVNTLGYPNTDTLKCPNLSSGNACQFQTFDKNYALFVYDQAVNQTTTTFALRDPYFTRWKDAGGISVLGPANSAETAFTTTSGATGTLQTFASGGVFNITGGNNLQPRILVVKPPVWTIYAANNGYAGFLGAPITEELILPNGNRRQSFEGGNVEYDPRVPGSETLRLPVRSIILAPQGPLRMNAGESATVRASLFAPSGEALTGRDIVWSTTNARIVALQPSAESVVLKAVGGGQASVTATSEGRTSTPLSIFVSAPCCAPGEGAPTTALQQAFQDAITRNRLNPRIPAARPAVRAGGGFVQEFADAETGAPFVIAVSERTLAGYLIRGAALAKYYELGGPTGALGYPVSDPAPSGRQLFENGALSGTPIQTVTGAILEKWALLGYENGLAGDVAGVVIPFLTFRATSGRAQSYQRAVLYELTSGPQASRVFVVAGLILAKYAASGGASGKLGAPLSDEYSIDGANRQDFEGGYAEYGAGAVEATIHEGPRVPVVTATPQIVSAGSVIRLAVGGFDPEARVRVSMTGKQDFEVVLASGAHVWQSYVPANSRSTQVTVRAVNLGTQESAQTIYSIRAAAEARVRWTIVRGDAQSAVPGGLTPQWTLLRLADDTGTPVPNAAVRVAASPGATIAASAPATDERGEIQVRMRVSLSEGIALGTVEAAGQIATVSARSVRSSLAGFQRLTQASDVVLGNGTDTIRRKGALLTSVAAVLRYYQNRGDLPAPLGLADPVLLNAHLRSLCAPDASGNQICDGFLEAPGSGEQIVNLWRAGSFGGGAMVASSEPAELSRIRDILASGTPAIVSLGLGTGESHAVVATGVSEMGAIRIADPDPAWNREYLEDFLTGFVSGGREIKASLLGVASLAPGAAPDTPAFLLATNATTVRVESPTGPCGNTFAVETAGANRFSMLRCDGATNLYQISLSRDSGPFGGAFTDLGTTPARTELGGGGAAAFTLSRTGNKWELEPLAIRVVAGGLVNAADSRPLLAPGSLATVYGTGFAQLGGQTAEPGSAVSVRVNDLDARVISSLPFQATFEIPASLSPGDAQVNIASSLGSASQPIFLQTAAPAIFMTGARSGQVRNSDGTANSRYNPALRGRAITVLVTGIQAESVSGITVDVAGRPLSPTALAAVSGSIGVYQISLTLPAAMPPGVGQELFVRQQDAASLPVEIAIE